MLQVHLEQLGNLLDLYSLEVVAQTLKNLAECAGYTQEELINAIKRNHLYPSA